jgi:hypothetical protein
VKAHQPILVGMALGPEHDPEKWKPGFREDHAQSRDEIMMRSV